jgi:hypothetical protein
VYDVIASSALMAWDDRPTGAAAILDNQRGEACATWAPPRELARISVRVSFALHAS